MFRFSTWIVAGVFAVASALPALADKVPLPELSRYLNDLTTVEASFRQFNEDGSVSTGKLYIKRPGRMRFEYDPPESAVVVAGSNTVVIFDTKSNQPPETYPLQRTPLNLILSNRVNLSRAKMVVDHRFDGTYTVVTAQDPENPEYGSIELSFGASPVELKGWVVNDANGGRTQVVLEQLDKGGNLSNRLFDVSRSRVRPGR